MTVTDTQWVTQLLSRYEKVVQHSKDPTASLVHSRNTLLLADAALRKADLSVSDPTHPLQVAIVGPTQSGKSTLVNVILDASIAGISALAGFTVHAQGYATECTQQQLDGLHALMHPLTRTAANALQADNLVAYVLEPVNAGSKALITPAVVWDTPDFDSIDAGTYTRAVLNTVALADIIILMVSKDKYGDKSVWEMLSLIQPLAKPLLVCINKLDPQDESAVVQAFANRYKEQFSQSALPELVMFPFIRKTQETPAVLFPDEPLNSLANNLNNAQRRVDRQSDIDTVHTFVDRHRSQWLKPLNDELQHRAAWQLMVEQATRRALQLYIDEYLDDSKKYDTFNRALAELLTLLEIPGLATTLARTRQVVTWPARKLLGIGRTAVSKQLTRTRQPNEPVDEEADALKRSLNGALINLQGELLEQERNPFWNCMNQAFREHEGHIRQRFNEQSDIARQQFEPQIEAAAQQLYEQLQSQPALLNSLRAARVTADAAGVALALKSGGLAPADLVLAPAMLSVTTLLTESALGRYLDTIKRELKERQRAHIDQQVMQGVLSAELSALPDTLDKERLFTAQLEPELSDALIAESP